MVVDLPAPFGPMNPMTSPVPTFHRFNGEGRENSHDDKDMILMRTELRDTAAIGVGVMDCDTLDGAPSNSEHWPVAVELSMKAVFGKIGQVTQHPKIRSNMSVLRPTTKEEEKEQYIDLQILEEVG